MNNLFGTDGIRNRVGYTPFTPNALTKLGKAIGRWATEKYQNPKIVIGYDTRISCDFVSSALKSGLLLFPLVIFESGIVPTPVLYYSTHKQKKFDIGIIISASHNPFYDNGLKIIDSKEGKISLQDQLLISSYFFNNEPSTYKTFGKTRIANYLKRDYLQHLSTYFDASFLNKKKVVLDCAHGATSKIAPKIFSSFGAHVVTIHDKPDGFNINHCSGALFPQRLQQAVLQEKADIGFAFDGDGDRVIVINRQGMIKDGDDLLALLIQHPSYKNGTTIVGTVMTNIGFQNYLYNNNIHLIRAAVGDIYVAQELQKHGLLLGGEQSGHIIMADYLFSGDGIFTALQILKVMISSNNNTLKTFKRFPQFLINLPIKKRKDLTSPDVVSIITKYQDQLNNGRLLVRYSGTQLYARIMIEHENKIFAQEIGNMISKELQKVLCS